MSTTRSPAPPEPATEAARSAALVICAHGASGGSESAQSLAAAIARDGGFCAVRGCALYGTPGLAETLAALAAPRIVVMPLLMAAGHTFEALSARIAAADDRRAILARPLGLSPALAPLVAAFAREGALARGWRARETALVLVGHGSRRHAGSGIAARGLAGRVAAEGGFAAVATAFLDGTPAVATVVSGLAAPRVLAVGLFLDQGAHGARDVPERLAGLGDRAAYLGPVGAIPGLARVVDAEARAALARAMA